MRNARTFAISLAASLALAACGGGGGTSSTIPRGSTPAAKGSATASLVVHWTTPSAQGIERRVRAISASAQSIVSSVNGNVVDITNRGGSAQATIHLDAPIGTDQFNFKIYDQPAGVGHLLGEASVAKAIVAGALNTLSATIEAVCGQTVATGVTTSHLPAIFTLAPAANSVAPPSVTAVEIVGSGGVELQVAAADADGNLILSGIGNPSVSAQPGGTIAAATVLDANDVSVGGNPSARYASSQLNLAAPGCPVTTVTVTTSSTFYIHNNTYTYSADRFGRSVALGSTGRLVGVVDSYPVFYDPANGNVSYTWPDFTGAVVMFNAQTGLALVAWDPVRHALLQVTPIDASSSTLYVETQGGTQHTTLPLHVTALSAGEPVPWAGSVGYFFGDGTHVVRIDPSTLAVGTVVATPYAFGGLGTSGNTLIVLNSASPFLTEYPGFTLPGSPSSYNVGFTSPLNGGFFEDPEDAGFLGISGGLIQHQANGGVLPFGSSLTGYTADFIAINPPGALY